MAGIVGSGGSSPAGGDPFLARINQVRGLRNEIRTWKEQYAMDPTLFHRVMGSVAGGDPTQKIFKALKQKIIQLRSESQAPENNPGTRGLIQGAISDMESILTQLRGQATTEDQNIIITFLEENLGQLSQENSEARRMQAAEDGLEYLDLGAGEMYIGQLNAERTPHGEGIEIRENFIYEGEFVNGVRQGHGSVIVSGDTYEGNFENGVAHGFGRMVLNDGRIFLGEFNRGEPVRGKIRWPNGDRYEGPISNFERHGRGKMYFHEGSSFSGTFVAGVAQGRGTILFANGDIQSGTMVDGLLHGPGTMCYGQPVRTGEIKGNFDRGVFTPTPPAPPAPPRATPPRATPPS